MQARNILPAQAYEPHTAVSRRSTETCRLPFMRCLPAEGGSVLKGRALPTPFLLELGNFIDRIKMFYIRRGVYLIWKTLRERN